MTSSLPDGLYDQLLTDDLELELGNVRSDQRTLKNLASGGARRLADALAEQLANVLAEIGPRHNDEDDSKQKRLQTQLEFVNAMLVDLRSRLAQQFPDQDYGAHVRLLANPARNLTAVHRKRTAPAAPETGLTLPWLFTAAKASPALLSELRHELGSSDSVNILMSFITVSGIRKIRDILHIITAVGGTGHARTRLRILTTTYIGATEAQAVDELARLPNCKVRISLDGRRTRLHAKAWIFERDSGFGTAYVGSANLTHAALAGGLEWTVKFSERGQGAMYRQAQAHFETLWHDNEFLCYDPQRPEHRAALDIAIAREKGGGKAPQVANVYSFFDLQPKNYQLEMLEQLQIEREHGRMRNLVVAATGTGKTVVAAFDYQRLCTQYGGRPRLLFIAHRIEILQQALLTYRQVLHDASFGQLLSGNHLLSNPDHLFATIDSVRTNGLLGRYGGAYWHTVVFDECHHMAAASFDAVAKRAQPTVMLGLTATPERSDGKPIAVYFDSRPDGSPAVELRLWHALDLQLLAPFEYFACDDSTDLRNIPWRQPGETALLDNVLGGNEIRARLIVGEWHRLCADPRASKAIAFCVSVRHAQFMTDQFNKAGLLALCVTGQSTQAERDAAPRFERAALGHERELVRQFGMANGALLQLLVVLARQHPLLGQFDSARVQALLGALDFDDAVLQLRFGVGKVAVPGVQGGVDQWPVVDQLAAQGQPFAGVALKRGDFGLVRQRRLVLSAVGVDVGKRLVPFGLEVDVGVRQVAPEDAQQIVLDLARTQPVEPQGAGEHALERFGQAGVFELENGEVRLVVLALLAAAVNGVAEFARRIAEHQFRAGRQMGFEPYRYTHL